MERERYAVRKIPGPGTIAVGVALRIEAIGGGAAARRAASEHKTSA